MGATIPQEELRNNFGEILRRAEAGEEFTVTVAGRPVARLGPARARPWVTGPALAAVFETATPQALAANLDALGAGLTDPFAV